jgi:hypothetical protein
VTDRAALLLRERELGAGLWPPDDRPVMLGRMDVAEGAVVLRSEEDLPVAVEALKDAAPLVAVDALTPRPPLPTVGEGETGSPLPRTGRGAGGEGIPDPGSTAALDSAPDLPVAEPTDALRDPAAAGFKDRASKLAALGMTGALEQLWRAQGMGDRERAATHQEKAAPETTSPPVTEPPPTLPTAGDMDYPSDAGRDGNGRLRVREYGPEDAYRVDGRPDPIEQAARLRSAGDEQPVQRRPEDGGAVPDAAPPEMGMAAPGPEAVAARLLAEILALDLGTMTPIRALTLLHELQTQARAALPWSSWMASMAGVREQAEDR